MANHNWNELLQTENEFREKLHRIVLKAIREQELLSQKLAEFEDRNPPLQSRIADRVARFGGSWTFILFFALFLLVWIGINVLYLLSPFDPYPFILLNLILSTLAALQAPVIMMSQNRKEEKDRQRAINDYLINLKAEIEIRNIHEKLDLLISDQMKTLFDIQKEQMLILEEIQDVMNQQQRL
jgi:uncharacterized membrane protein